MGDVHDIDSDIRNELERDVRSFVANQTRKLDGIIVSGDIAFAGKPEEFAFGQAWIEKLRELVDCPADAIMVTPGNHDVDQEKLVPDIEQMHAEIRAVQNVHERDELIARILRDPAKSSQIMEPISAYNEFAKKYGCNVSAENPYWERDFPMGNRGKLRIRGVTSTLISGRLDNEQTHRVVYGGSQRTLLREEGVIRMLVGHHPPSWTLEGDDADKAFGDRCALELFGHKHTNWYNARRGVRVIAGAVHPERNAQAWDPRYSVVAVKALEDGGLRTRVYPRRWSNEETTFIPDINSHWLDYRDHVVAAG